MHCSCYSLLRPGTIFQSQLRHHPFMHPFLFSLQHLVGTFHWLSIPLCFAMWCFTTTWAPWGQDSARSGSSLQLPQSFPYRKFTKLNCHSEALVMSPWGLSHVLHWALHRQTQWGNHSICQPRPCIPGRSRLLASWAPPPHCNKSGDNQEPHFGTKRPRFQTWFSYSAQHFLLASPLPIGTPQAPHIQTIQNWTHHSAHSCITISGKGTIACKSPSQKHEVTDFL